MAEQLIEIEGVDRLIRGLDEANKKLVLRAASDALTTTAFNARTELIDTAEREFDKPTKFTLGGFLVKKSSFKKRPIESEVLIKDQQTKYLTFQVFGGVRRAGDYAATKQGVLLGVRQKLNKFGNFPLGPIRYLARKTQFDFIIGPSEGRQRLPPGVYKRGRGKSRKLIFQAAFRDSATYKPNKLPFFEVVDKTFNKDFDSLFSKNFDKEFSNSNNWK